jgi:hypothetical protein
MDTRTFILQQGIAYSQYQYVAMDRHGITLNLRLLLTNINRKVVYGSQVFLNLYAVH